VGNLSTIQGAGCRGKHGTYHVSLILQSMIGAPWRCFAFDALYDVLLKLSEYWGAEVFMEKDLFRNGTSKLDAAFQKISEKSFMRLKLSGLHDVISQFK
jgi:hypothetical protein